MGWYPAAPRVGTQMTGMGMGNPIPGAQGVRTVEYRDEDYATSHNVAIVTAPNFVPCKGLPLPVGDTDQIACLAGEYRQCLNEHHGVVATKGELIWVHNPEQPDDVKSSLEDKRVAYIINAKTYDYTAVSTQGITLPRLNAYFNLFAQQHPFKLDRLVNFLRFELHFLGVVDSVGPGQTNLTDRVRKNYVCVAQRIAKGVADIWHASMDPTAGQPGAMQGYRPIRSHHHRPGAMLFVLVTARVVEDQANPANSAVYEVRFEPLACISYMALRRMIAEIDRRNRKVLQYYYIGSYRYPTSGNGASSTAPTVNTTQYINGNSTLQNGVPQCDVSVDL